MSTNNTNPTQIGTFNTGVPVGIFNVNGNTVTSGAAYHSGTSGPYTNYSVVSNAYMSGIVFPSHGEAVVEKLSPIKTIRSIDEPFQPSCEQT